MKIHIIIIKTFMRNCWKLRQVKIAPICIYITAFKEGEDGDTYFISNFNEDDNLLYYDVSGGDDENDVYGLEACSFESWLSFYIDQETLDRFTNPNIIAHCLWEMTFFGFEQKRDEDGLLILD